MLLYSGQPAGIKRFMPSIKLKLYREAAEDYEYIVFSSGGNRNFVFSTQKNSVNFIK